MAKIDDIYSFKGEHYTQWVYVRTINNKISFDDDILMLNTTTLNPYGMQLYSIDSNDRRFANVLNVLFEDDQSFNKNTRQYKKLCETREKYNKDK